MEDVQQYITGKMNEADRQRFEQRVEAEPLLRTELDVHLGLNQLKLEKEVKGAIKVRQQRQNLRRVMIGGTLFLVAGIVVYFFVFKPSIRPATDTPEMEKKESENNERSPRETPEGAKNIEIKTSGNEGKPMAERKVKFTEKHLMRGVYSDLDADTRDVLDILLVRTQKIVYDAPDQVAWRSVIQDLASGKLENVRATTFQLEKQYPTQAEWVLALALLAEGKIDDAQAAFKKISQNTSHPQHENALWALEKLQ